MTEEGQRRERLPGCVLPAPLHDVERVLDLRVRVGAARDPTEPLDLRRRYHAHRRQAALTEHLEALHEAGVRVRVGVVERVAAEDAAHRLALGGVEDRRGLGVGAHLCEFGWQTKNCADEELRRRLQQRQEFTAHNAEAEL